MPDLEFNVMILRYITDVNNLLLLLSLFLTLSIITFFQKIQLAT
jgi:hypothetical protein